MQLSDHLSRLDAATYIVAVTEEVILETSDPTIDKTIARGLYGFTDKDKARHFTTVLNRATEETVAYFYSRNTDHNTTERN